jgi:hypothetical protein
MTLRNRRYLTAWLGVIAMWLIVFAPVISQLVVRMQLDEPVATLCSALTPGSPAHHAPADSLAACGYCDLLAGHAAAPPVPPLAMVFLAVVVVVAAQRLATGFVPLGAFPSGRPRAPPLAF